MLVPAGIVGFASCLGNFGAVITFAGNIPENRDIDWIVVCMHQVAISTADKANGADLGIREEWLPLFDQYNVDLVVCGHEHHYERSHPIRGQEANRTLAAIRLRLLEKRAH